MGIYKIWDDKNTRHGEDNMVQNKRHRAKCEISHVKLLLTICGGVNILAMNLKP